MTIPPRRIGYAILSLLFLLVPHHAHAQSTSYTWFPDLANGNGCATIDGNSLCNSAAAACDSIATFYGSNYGNVIVQGPPVVGVIGILSGLGCAYHYIYETADSISEVVPPGLCGDVNSFPGNAPCTGVMDPKQIGGGNCGDCSNDNLDDVQPNSPTDPATGSKPTSTGKAYVGEPVNIATGNMAYHVTDYATSGQNKLSFTRYYNSRGLFSGTLGANWHSSFDRWIQLYSSSTQVAVQRADGQLLTFTLVSGTWATDADVDYGLVHTGSNWVLTTPDDTIETYAPVPTSAPGNTFLVELISIQKRNGYTQTLAYNSAGQLSSVVDSYGRSFVFGYNGNYLATSLTTPEGTMIVFGYTATMAAGDLRGQVNLTSVTYPTSPVSTLTYQYQDSNWVNLLTGVVDENANVYLSWTYDVYGRTLSSTNGTGANATTTTVSYDDTTGNRSVTNPLGVMTTFSFTTLQNSPKIQQISRAATGTTAAAAENFGYDGYGYLNSATDWNGNQTTYANNGHGLPLTINEAVGTGVARTTTIIYDGVWGRLPQSIATPGLTTTYTYDSGGEVLTKTLTDTTTTTSPYSTGGQARVWTFTWLNQLLNTVKTPRGYTTTFGYDGMGALTSVTDALRHVTNITAHTGGGLPTTIVDPNGVTTNFAYTPRQWLTTSTVNTGGGPLTTTFDYDAAGELIKTTLPDGSYLSRAYDTAHRLIQATDADGNCVAFTLDALGDHTQENTYDIGAALRRKHSGAFDALGRLLIDTAGAGQTTTFTYDNNGNALTVKDGLSHTTTLVFDALNRLSTSTDPNGGVTQYGYDAHDRLLSLTDALGDLTRWVRNGPGDAIQQVSPDSGTAVYYFNADGLQVKKVDARNVTENRGYDPLDRVLSVTYPAGAGQNVTYTYDASYDAFGYPVGRLATRTDASGLISFDYDERGNALNAKRWAAGVPNLSTYYGYDGANRLNSVGYPSGLNLSYLRDLTGAITTAVVTPPATGGYVMANITNAPFGPPTAINFNNGVNNSFTLDQDYRLTNVTAATGAATLQNYTYTLDNDNNVKVLTDALNAANTQNYGYDIVNRLTAAKSGAGGYGSYRWTYDKVGNRLTQAMGSSSTTYGYTPGSNRLASISTSGRTLTVTTNANGNITGIPPVGGSTAATFTYNVANRLASVTGTPLGATYTLDGWGERWKKQQGSDPAVYYDYGLSSELLEETDGTNVTDYLYVDNRLIGIWLPGGPGGTLNYITTDRLGTPQLATNGSAATVWKATYQPFGKTFSLTGSLTQNVRFPGQYFDSEDGFSYNLNRDYMPNLGRYLEADPIGLVGGVNLYRYNDDDPLGGVDSTGLTGNKRYPVDDSPATPGEWIQDHIDKNMVNVYVNGQWLPAYSPDMPEHTNCFGYTLIDGEASISPNDVQQYLSAEGYHPVTGWPQPDDLIVFGNPAQHIVHVDSNDPWDADTLIVTQKLNVGGPVVTGPLSQHPQYIRLPWVIERR